MDVLSRLIQNGVKNKKIDTYQVNGATSISHLMYADDILIFSKANPKSLNAIKTVLEKFSLFSGLEVNASKSSSTFSKVCAENQSLHNILGYTVKSLPITYLGLPITGKKKSFGQCWKLIQSIEALLARWSGKCLSYGGRIQLVNWIIARKYTYWAQGMAIPDSVAKKVRRLAYRFIWDGRKGIPWAQMILPKSEGGLGVRDLPIITTATNIKRASKYWDKSDSILVKWIQDRYIKGKTLNDIQIRPTVDSHFWKAFVSERNLVDKCLDCRANSTIMWRSGSPINKLGGIVESIRDRKHKDMLAEGIWSKMPTKFSILLWRVKWDHLNTFRKLRNWRVQVPPACLLCNLEDETRSHLFFNCFYSRSLLIPLAEHLDFAFWKIMNIPVPTQSSPDIRLGDLTEVAQKITRYSPPLGVNMECYWVLVVAYMDGKK